MDFPSADSYTRGLDDTDYKELGRLLHLVMTNEEEKEKARDGYGPNASWHFTLHGEFRKTAREWVIEDLKKVGFHRVTIVSSSEQGERPGLTGVRVFAHPEEK